MAVTPREAQVRRFIEADELFEQNIATIEGDGPYEMGPGGPLVVPFGPRPTNPGGLGSGNPPPVGLTAQQSMIAGQAIDHFIARVCGVSPRTGLRDIPADQLARMRDLALGDLQPSRPPW